MIASLQILSRMTESQSNQQANNLTHYNKTNLILPILFAITASNKCTLLVRTTEGQRQLSRCSSGFKDIHSLMELNSSWEAANSAATQERPSILWNPKVHYRLHKSPPLIPILSHIIPAYPSKIHPILSTHLRLGLPSGLFPSGVSTNILYAFRFSPFVLHALPISSFLTWSF
jgi:hypothetical protein